MFVRRKGRRFLLLHSYRDGRGKVRQRRLGDFRDASGLERQLVRLSQSCPELTVDLAPLRARAESMLGAADPAGQPTPGQRVDKIRRATRALLTLLAEEEDPEVLGQVAADLGRLQSRLNLPGNDGVEGGDEQGLRRLVCQARSQLSPRRRRFDPSDLKAQPYLESLDRLSELLIDQGRLQESAAVLEERVCCCPTRQAQLTYGALLQGLGRATEAAEQYTGLSNEDAWRHYNLASACWRENCPDQTLVHLLRGLTRDPRVVGALKRIERGKPVVHGGEYWDHFGQLWTAEARRFILAICDQHLVRRRLRIAKEQRVAVRNLIPDQSKGWLLQRGLAAAHLLSDRAMKGGRDGVTQPAFTLNIGVGRN